MLLPTGQRDSEWLKCLEFNLSRSPISARFTGGMDFMGQGGWKKNSLGGGASFWLDGISESLSFCSDKCYYQLICRVLLHKAMYERS